MTEPVMPPEDELLAFMRGELDADAERRLLERASVDPALRMQLAHLRMAAGEALADGAKATDAEAFARLQDLIAAARTKSAERGAGFMAACSSWLRAHSLALQGALAVLVVAQAVVLAGILMRHTPTVPTSPALVRGGTQDCLIVNVRFKAGVREDQIGNWLVQYGATIVSGPTVAGLYQIRLPDARSLREFVTDPQAQALAEAIQPPPGCEPWPTNSDRSYSTPRK